jgi:hypothetical protein
LMHGLDKELNQVKTEQVLKLGKNLTEEKVQKILNQIVRIEKVAVKEEKQSNAYQIRKRKSCFIY